MADNLKYVILGVGHCAAVTGTSMRLKGETLTLAKSKGLKVSSNGEVSEFDFNRYVCSGIQSLINKTTDQTGIFAYLACRQNIGGTSIPNTSSGTQMGSAISSVNSFIAKNPGKVVCTFDFHCNGGGGQYCWLLTGAEGSPAHDNLYVTMKNAVKNIFGNTLSKIERKSRGKYQGPGMGWTGIKVPSMLLEPFFMDNSAHCKVAIEKLDDMISEYAKAILSYAAGQAPQFSKEDLADFYNPTYAGNITASPKFTDEQIKSSATNTQKQILHHESQLGPGGNYYEVTLKNKYTSIGCGTFTATPYRVDPRGASISRPFVRETGTEGYNMTSPTYEYVDVVSSMPVGHHTEQVAGHHKMAAFETTIASTGWSRLAGSFVDIGAAKQVSLTGNQVALTSGGSMAIAAPLMDIQSDSFGVKGMMNVDGKALFNGMIYAGESITAPQLNVVGVNEESSEVVAGVELAGDSSIGGTLIESNNTTMHGGEVQFDDVKGTISVKVTSTNTGLKPVDANKSEINTMTLEIDSGTIEAILTKIVTNLFQSHNYNGFMDKFNGCGPDGTPMMTQPHSHEYMRPQGMMADSIDSLNSSIGPVINNPNDNRKQMMTLRTGGYTQANFV